MQVADDLAAFVQREYPRLVAVLSAHCRDRHVAEELAQDALERACDRWSHVQTLDNPGAWVHRVALNLMRKLGARNRVEIAMWAYETRRIDT